MDDLPHTAATLTLLYEADQPFPHRIWQSDKGFIQIDYVSWKPGSPFPDYAQIFCDGVLENFYTGLKLRYGGPPITREIKFYPIPAEEEGDD